MDEIEKLRHRIGALEKKFVQFKTQIEKDRLRFTNFNVHKTEEYLDAIKGKVLKTNRQISLHIHKNTVLTEVTRHVEMVQPAHALAVTSALIRAMDYIDDWWAEKEGYTLLQWCEVAKNLIEDEDEDMKRLISWPVGND